MSESRKIIDIRDKKDYDEFHIPRSINIARIALLNSPEKYIKKDEKAYIICEKGKQSLFCCKILNALGYNCTSVDGGIIEYKKRLNK